MINEKQLGAGLEEVKPVRDLFRSIMIKLGSLEFGFSFCKEKYRELMQISNSVTQDIRDLEELLIRSGLYDNNFICLSCFIKKQNLAKGIYHIPPYLKEQERECHICGEKTLCRIDLEVK